MPTGSKQAISWILTLFIIGLMGGALVYVVAEFNESVSTDPTETTVSDWVNSLYGIFEIVPTWVEILVIVGFAGSIALVGLMIYKVFSQQGRSDKGGL